MGDNNLCYLIVMKYTPRDFASECPPPRIIGTEVEYHVQPDDVWGNKEIAAGLSLLGLRNVGGYYSNGARVYQYSGIEYASPECLGPRSAAAAEFAGMALIKKLTDTKEKLFPVLRNSGAYSVAAGKVNTRGYHQNFLVPLPEEDKQEQLKAMISAFLATRIAWDGAGLATPGGYLLSQKAPGIGAPVINGGEINRTVHGEKPLAGFFRWGKDSDVMDKIGGGWALLEVRCADPHMSISQTYASLAITSLALRLFEQRIINEHNLTDFALKDPVKSLHQINTQMGRGKIELESGNSTTALGLQKRFGDAILQLAEKTDLHLPSDEQAAASKLTTMCDSLEGTEELKPLVPGIEWATKKYYSDKKTGSLKEELAFDLKWHRIDERSVGLTTYKKLYEKLGIGEPNSAWQSDSKPKTRAAARGAAIASGKCTSANWNHLTVDGLGVDLKDYWDSELPTPTRTATWAA